MSQQKKLEIKDRVRTFRVRAQLSQDDLADRLGVSGNYISLIELGKKEPGPSLLKLFESLEQSPLYRIKEEDENSVPESIPANPLFSMISTGTLIKNFADVAEKLSTVDNREKKHVLGILREMLDAIQQRLLASSGELSEAQRIAAGAAKSDENRGTK